MRSAARGKPTSRPEVTNVSSAGLWILIDGQENFLPFAQFPWFRNATIAQLTNVRRPSPHHLHWPDLDVDLSVESIESPEDFPLVSRLQSPNPSAERRTVRARTRTTRSGRP
jgi:hypothetical protein